MSVHLVGGGRDLGLATSVYGPFLAEAVIRPRTKERETPRVGVVAVAEAEVLTAGVDWFYHRILQPYSGWWPTGPPGAGSPSTRTRW